jgi:nonspecific dipeptidase
LTHAADWLGQKKPCITYGLRGIVYFMVEIEGSAKDLHSGVFGGVIHEPMIDLTRLLAKIVDSNGNILIPGISENVRKLTEEEKQLYGPIDFDPEAFRREAGAVGKLIHGKKEDILMHRWRFPSLSIHGVEGAFYGSGCKTVVPRKVIGKFSIRLVPDMTPEEIEKKVISFMQAEFATFNSGCTLKVYNEHGGKPFLSDVNHPNYLAGRNAIKAVFGVEPDLTREVCQPVSIV